MRNEPIKVGVIGVGHLGQHHVKHYISLKDANLVGILDTDQKRAAEISNKFDIPLFNELQDFLNKVDAVSIVTPTPYHAKMAEICIANDTHVFIEKPITETVEEAEQLLVLAKEKDVMIQVGHIERLNPALLALKPYRVEPKFLEIHRLAP